MKQTRHNEQFTVTFARLEHIYNESVRKHGDSPQATQQTDRDTQEQRMRVLCQVADLKDAKILDFGCGTGYLLDFMQKEYAFNGEYVGYDIARGMVTEAAAKHPNGRFERRDIMTSGIPEDFDVVVATGTFNNATGDNWMWMTACLEILWHHTRKALAFNNLSVYVDYFDEGLYYEDPARVFQFCKERLSPHVTTRHDYCVRPHVVPYEFTTYVYRSEMAPRQKCPALVQRHDQSS
jgi:SAM-dependent methyltransferase